MNEIVLPWPPRDLSPNARAHWRAKSRVAKSYRDQCHLLTIAARMVAPAGEKIHLWIDFIPPNRRLYDADNCVAWIKNGLDGLALGLGVNDRKFVLHPFLRDELGGMVKIRLTDGPEATA